MIMMLVMMSLMMVIMMIPRAAAADNHDVGYDIVDDGDNHDIPCCRCR